MPCSDGPSQSEFDHMQRKANKEKYGVYASDLDIATRVACDLSTLIVPAGPQTFTPLPLTIAWVKEHEAIDRKREAAELKKQEQDTAKTAALSKLSPAEKEALGL